MHGSEAEVRIRDKTEALLRECFPDARIVHEFPLGGVRMDIAAVTPDSLILAEIKSERDTLDRLANQVRAATCLGGEVWVCYHERWQEDIRWRCRQHTDEPIAIQGMPGAYSYGTNPDHVPGLSSCVLLSETAETPLTPDRWTRDPRDRRYRTDRFDSRQLLGLIHKPELLALAKPHGAKTRMTSCDLIALCHEHMTGRQIRRGVLAAIRAHHFFWADPPIALTQGPD